MNTEDHEEVWKMSLRQAYEIVIANELSELGYDEEQIRKLVSQLSGNEQFHKEITEAIENHMDTFDTNYDF